MSRKLTLHQQFAKGGCYAFDTKTHELFSKPATFQQHLDRRFKAEFPAYLLYLPNKDEDNYKLHIDHPKVVSICPYRMFPDVTRLHVEIVPEKFVLELAAFAKFLELFTTIGITHESLAVAVRTFLGIRLQPQYVDVTARFDGFAGMTIVVTT